MSTKVLFAVACLLVLDHVWGQSLNSGSCENVTLQENFVLKDYLGKWYETERTFAIFQDGLDCVTAVYTLNPNNTVTVNNTGFNIETQKSVNAIGIATVDNPNNPADLSVKFDPRQPKAAYSILATDYSNYALVYSCNNVALGWIRTENLWILSRKPTLDAAMRQKLYDILDQFKIDRSGFNPTDQVNCPKQN